MMRGVVRNNITGELEDALENYTLFRASIAVEGGKLSLVFDPKIYPHCEIALIIGSGGIDDDDDDDMMTRSFPLNSDGFLKFVKNLVPEKKDVVVPEKKDVVVPEKKDVVTKCSTEPVVQHRKKSSRGKNVTSEFFK
jgi:hypothetical protein